MRKMSKDSGSTLLFAFELGRKKLVGRRRRTNELQIERKNHIISSFALFKCNFSFSEVGKKVFQLQPPRSSSGAEIIENFARKLRHEREREERNLNFKEEDEVKRAKGFVNVERCRTLRCYVDELRAVGLESFLGQETRYANYYQRIWMEDILQLFT